MSREVSRAMKYLYSLARWYFAMPHYRPWQTIADFQSRDEQWMQVRPRWVRDGKE